MKRSASLWLAFRNVDLMKNEETEPPTPANPVKIKHISRNSSTHYKQKHETVRTQDTLVKSRAGPGWPEGLCVRAQRSGALFTWLPGLCSGQQKEKQTEAQAQCQVSRTSS